MLVEEYGLATVLPNPLLAALATFLAFVACGSIPLLPYLANSGEPFPLAILVTGIVFFGIGAAKSRWALAPWWWSGLETLFIGAIAAGFAYTIGYLLAGLA